MSDQKKTNTATQLAHLGSTPADYSGVVNPPVHRASTIVINNYEDFKNCFTAPYRYGREATPSSRAFETSIAALDGAYNAIATSSGLAAIVGVLNACAHQGAHFLVPDNFYGFSREYCEDSLKRFGVTTTFYDPMIDKAGLEALITTDTTLLYLESPGSLTYEVQDIGMFVEVAKAHNLVTACDNSWATPLNFKPLDHGIDIAIISATKYISGHSDAMLGVVSCKTEAIYKRVLTAIRQSGNCPGSEEVYLGLRGLRTLDVRMKQHTESGLTLGQWLSDHPAVKTVLHPALPSCAGHENWKKYFTGTSGVFAIVLHETDTDKIGDMLDHLQIFKMGFSWGGYESLIFPEQLNTHRTTKPWQGDGFLLRIHPGLEAVEDLKADLESALSQLG